MQNIHEVIGISAGIIGLAGYVPYIISTYRGVTKPNRATWFIWTLVGGLLAFSYMAAGDEHAIWLPLGYFFGPLIVAILSLRYGYATWTRLDTICVTAAILSIIPWVLAENPTITLLINVLIDAVGAVPTLVKTYHEPETEDFSAWLVFFIANTLNLFALTSFDLTVLYPAYLFFLAAGITLLTFSDKWKRRSAK